MYGVFWQGKGEFTMEYFQHAAVPQDVQSQLVKEYSSKRATV
jgi:elongation factor G